MTDFDRLRMAAVGRLGSRDAFLYALDLLEINGDDLRPYEWQVRRTRLHAFSAKRAEASGCPITSIVPTASPCFDTLAPWGLRALSRSAGIGPIVLAGPQTG